LKRKPKPRTDKRLAFRKTLKSIASANPESKRIYDEIRREAGQIPEIYRVKALADKPKWLGLLHHSVFQWPKNCALDEKTKELVGLAKSIGHLWEPGILTNIEGAINAGASSEEITEAILVASTIIGLADIDYGFRSANFQIIESSPDTVKDACVREVYDDASATFGRVPELYRFSILLENPDWLQAIHESAKIRYTDGVLGRKTKALVCLGASAAKRWNKGIEEHMAFALKAGARPREIADVLCSAYKTAASIGVQAGFSVPCSTPEMLGFKLL